VGEGGHFPEQGPLPPALWGEGANPALGRRPLLERGRHRGHMRPAPGRFHPGLPGTLLYGGTPFQTRSVPAAERGGAGRARGDRGDVRCEAPHGTVIAPGTKPAPPPTPRARAGRYSDLFHAVKNSPGADAGRRDAPPRVGVVPRR
jgi:hypothetical protein